MVEYKVFTLSQVAQHKSNKDCWLVILGKVLNVTKFLEEHPGGEEVLLENGGTDVTKLFDDIGHSNAAKKMLLKYQVGVLQGYTVNDSDAGKNPSSILNEPEKKGMSAYILKNGGKPKYAAFLENFVPLFVAVFYFGCRYMTEIQT